MKMKIIISYFLGGVLAAFLELLSIYRQNVFLTHETHSIVIMVITAFMEGSLLFTVFTWRNKIQYKCSWQSCILYIGLLVLYYYVRGITMTFSLFMSTLPSVFFGLIIFKLTGMKVSMEIVGTVFTVLIDVALLLLVFYPLLTIGNRWVSKKQSTINNKEMQMN